MNEQEVKGYNDATRVLFQEPQLLPWKSVIDNVSICAVDKSKESALRALGNVGLRDKENEWPAKLSGGQRQRVALARALSAKPQLLLLDEPLGALDALTRIDMQSLIESLWQQEGFTVLLVTHDVSEAVTLADRVILIEEGEIAMNIKIELPRPRIRDNDFVYYERKILNRVMGIEEEDEFQSRLPEFSI